MLQAVQLYIYTNCFADDQDFPSLAVPSTNSTQVPNFWKDRRAFVDDARPATEGEEAEMVRRALEESRLMEEARQKTLLAEAESRRSLYVDSTLFLLIK